MKRPFLLFIFLLVLSSSLFAAGKIYWQADGVLISGIDGMGIGDFIADMRGGAYNITGDLDSVYVIRIDKSGNLPWGLLGKVVDNDNFGGAAFQMNPRGVSDGKGGAIIVWDKFFSTGHELYYQRIDSLGNKMWGSAQKVTLSDSSQENHVVVSDGMGGAIVAWQQFIYSDGFNYYYDIYSQRIGSNGIKQWGDYGVAVCTSYGTQDYPQITYDSKGDGVIAWVYYRNGEYDIFAQRFDSSGTLLWQTNGIGICDTDSAQTFSWGYFPYGTNNIMTTDTSAVVAWVDQRSGNCDIYAQALNLGGAELWTHQGTPICDTIGLQRSCQVMPDGKGNVIFSWLDERNGCKNIYVQRMNSNGQKLWGNQGIAICASDSADWCQRMASDDAGGAIICWQDKRSGNTDIYAQHVDSSGNAKWLANGMAVCTAIGRQEWPFMTASDSGTAIIGWADGRSGQWRAYAQRVGDDPNGVGGTPNSELQITNCKLYQNAPNPFSSNTCIRYSISDRRNIRLNIYNINGQIVRVLVSGFKEPGNHFAEWDGRDENKVLVASGVYFYRLTVNNNYSITKKLTIIK